VFDLREITALSEAILSTISAYSSDVEFTASADATPMRKASPADSARVEEAIRRAPKPNLLRKMDLWHSAVVPNNASHHNGGPASAPAAPAGGDFLSRLRSGDKKAFRALVQKHHASLTRFAQKFVGTRATADEVVQDTWMAVVEGLPGFEARSSLKNWIFAILANKARSRAVRDKRLVTAGNPTGDIDDDGSRVDSFGFDASGEWTDPLSSSDELTPERVVSSRQILAHVIQAIDILPPGQKCVMFLRQIKQLNAQEVGALLGISAANQRLLLHRARAKLREYVEQPLHRHLGRRLVSGNQSRIAQKIAQDCSCGG